MILITRLDPFMFTMTKGDSGGKSYPARKTPPKKAQQEKS